MNFDFDEESLLKTDLLFPLFGMNVVEFRKRFSSEAAVQKLNDYLFSEIIGFGVCQIGLACIQIEVP